MPSFRMIAIEKVRPGRLNPRLEFRQESLDELAKSIRSAGVLEPILVRPRGSQFEVVVGERRYRAARQAGLEEIPAVVRNLTDGEVLELNLLENVQREDLTDVEKGRTCLKLLKEFPDRYPNRQTLADHVGVSDRTVGNWIRTVENLPVEIQRMVATTEKSGEATPAGKISAQVALNIGRQVKGMKRQVRVAKILAEKRVPLHRARKVISKIAREPDRPIGDIVKEVLEAPPELPFRLDHVERIRKGTKTQTTRKGLPDPRIREGAVVYASIYEPRVVKLRVVSVARTKLGNFTEEDAEQEGGYTLAEFRRVWKSIHEEGWEDRQPVVVVRFRKE